MSSIGERLLAAVWHGQEMANGWVDAAIGAYWEAVVKSCDCLSARLNEVFSLYPEWTWTLSASPHDSATCHPALLRLCLRLGSMVERKDSDRVGREGGSHEGRTTELIHDPHLSRGKYDGGCSKDRRARRSRSAQDAIRQDNGGGRHNSVSSPAHVYVGPFYLFRTENKMMSSQTQMNMLFTDSR